jgi:hypothetical protein
MLLESRFARADLQRDRQLTAQCGEFEKRMDRRLAEMDRRLDRLERDRTATGAELHRIESEQLMWVVVLWSFTLVGFLAVLFTLSSRG